MRRIPIFPLPGVVLMPGTMLPLHIFEPRYRALVADALAGDRTIGMTMLYPGWESANAGEDPRIYAVGGAGEIVESEELEDGRYNILLEGRFRYRVSTKPPPAPIASPGSRRSAPCPSPTRPRKTRVTQAAAALFGDMARELELPPLPAETLSPERLASEIALRLRYCAGRAPGDSRDRLGRLALRDPGGADARVEGPPPVPRAVPAVRAGSPAELTRQRFRVETASRNVGSNPTTLQPAAVFRIVTTWRTSPPWNRRFRSSFPAGRRPRSGASSGPPPRPALSRGPRARSASRAAPPSAPGRRPGGCGTRPLVFASSPSVIAAAAGVSSAPQAASEAAGRRAPGR